MEQNLHMKKQGLLREGDSRNNMVYILQGALWCKGYNPGGFTGTFGPGTRAAVAKVQSDAGLPIVDGVVYSYVSKQSLQWMLTFFYLVETLLLEQYNKH